jgi:hypothetical protein
VDLDVRLVSRGKPSREMVDFVESYA